MFTATCTTLVINGVTITSDEWGAFDLTDAHSKLGLPRKASPSQWRHRHRAFLEPCDHVTAAHDATHGTLTGLLSWIAWFDYGLYVSVMSCVSADIASPLRKTFQMVPQHLSVHVNREVAV